MPADEPKRGTIEILPPGKPGERPDRRRGNAAFRPYSPLDGRAPDAPIVTTDRRARRRAAAEPGRGCLIDLES